MREVKLGQIRFISVKWIAFAPTDVATVSEDPIHLGCKITYLKTEDKLWGKQHNCSP